MGRVPRRHGEAGSVVWEHWRRRWRVHWMRHGVCYRVRHWMGNLYGSSSHVRMRVGDNWSLHDCWSLHDGRSVNNNFGSGWSSDGPWSGDDVVHWSCGNVTNRSSVVVCGRSPGGWACRSGGGRSGGGLWRNVDWA